MADYLTTDQNGKKIISLITTDELRYVKQFATNISHQLHVKLESKLLKAMKNHFKPKNNFTLNLCQDTYSRSSIKIAFINKRC